MRSSSESSRELSRGRQQKWTNSRLVSRHCHKNAEQHTILALVQVDVSRCLDWLDGLLCTVPALPVLVWHLWTELESGPYNELALTRFEGDKRLDGHGGGGALLGEQDQEEGAASARVRAG